MKVSSSPAEKKWFSIFKSSTNDSDAIFGDLFSNHDGGWMGATAR